MSVTWEELRGRSLARQLPDLSHLDPTDPASVAAALEATGPVQSQTARSPYVGLAARLPGLTRDTVTAAHEQLLVVRGSNLRGTVHTSTPGDHVLMEVATRVALRRTYDRTWATGRTKEVWAEVEAYAADEWRTAQEVHDHVRAWLAEHDPAERPKLDELHGRSMSNGHGGLVRRPLTGGWEGQGKPVYRTATSLLGERDAALADTDGSLDALVLRHVTCHGPSSRQDVAWWSGLGLRVVDACLARLDARLVALEGPDGRTYHDLVDGPAPTDRLGVRLLPEFDATICAYASDRRDRFVSTDDFARLWNKANALVSAPVMVDGLLRGHWRLEGSGKQRRLDVLTYPGTRRLRRGELEGPAAALATAYGVGVSDLTISSAT